MKAFNSIKKSRLKVTFYTNIFLGVLAISCLFIMYKKPELDLTGVITTCVAGILTITTMFIGGDSHRKSETYEES